jgi:hypothetical protein
MHAPKIVVALLTRGWKQMRQYSFRAWQSVSCSLRLASSGLGQDMSGVPQAQQSFCKPSFIGFESVARNADELNIPVRH